MVAPEKREELNTHVEEEEHKFRLLNVVVLFFSLYVFGILLVESFVSLPTQTSRLLNFIDNIICGFFFIEFLIRFSHAENKWKFMKWGWIDLISSIPNIDFLRYGRAVRLFRLIRIIRAFRSLKFLWNYLFVSRAKGTLTTVAILATMVLLFSSIAILQVETAPNSNIKTAEDALWWSYTTITTVGYGDKYPVTRLGRIIAVLLMTVGVGLFGTFTAFVSSWIMKGRVEVEEERKTEL